MNSYYPLGTTWQPSQQYNGFNSANTRESALKGIIDQATRELNAIQEPPQPVNYQLVQPQQVALSFKFVDSQDEVNKEIVFNETLFMSKDYKNFWIKSMNGKLRSFSLTEIIQKDEKDLKIEQLQNEINELKRGINNVNSKHNGANGYTKHDDEFVSDKSSNVQSSSTGISKKH